MVDEAVVAAAVSQTMKGETFLRHWIDMREAKDEVSSGAMEVARAKKAAKRDGADLAVVAVLERLAKLDEGDRIIFMSKLDTYARWISLPLGAFSMGLPAPEVRTSARDDFDVWQAGQEGHRAGLNGTQREANPYQSGTAKYQSWDKRWNAGFKTQQRKVASDMVRGTGGARTQPPAKAADNTKVTPIGAGRKTPAPNGEASPAH
jgi:ribosome modulation factor